MDSATPSHTVSDAELSGYLQKKTRDGRWQKRWFETSGVYLTYYKSKKMEKLLAALSLPQVAGIRVVDMDNLSENPERLDGLFALELSTRVYILRARSNDEASLWVKTLLKLRAQGAASGQSNPMGLVNATMTGTTDFFDRDSDHTHDGGGGGGKPPSSGGGGGGGCGGGSGGDRSAKNEWVKSMRGCMPCC
jgi:uncharacterized membrane protein YgcG